MKSKLIAVATAAAVAVSTLSAPVAGAQTSSTVHADRTAQIDAVVAQYKALGLGDAFLAALKVELTDDIRDSERDFQEDIAQATAVAQLLENDKALRDAYLAKQNAAIESNIVGPADLNDDFIDPVDVYRAVGITAPQPSQPSGPTNPSPIADRETALKDTLAKFTALGLADSYVKALETDLRDDINDRDDRDFEEDLAQANRFAGALTADEAKLDYFKKVAEKVTSYTDLDGDMYDIVKLDRVIDRGLTADKAYRELQDDDLGDRIKDRIENGSSGSSRLDELEKQAYPLDDLDDVFEIIAAILGVLGLVGVGAAVAKVLDIF